MSESHDEFPDREGEDESASDSMALHDLARAVDSKESFLKFVRALAADRADEVRKERIKPSSPYGPGANGWENGSIESYLEAAVAWAEDSTPDYALRILPETPTWHTFASFLLAGKYYE